MDSIVRNAKHEDFPEVLALFGQLWPGKPLNPAELRRVFERGLKSEADEFLCAESTGKVIGFCAYTIVNNFWQEGKISYIYAMVVDDSVRGQGVGTKIMQFALEQARAKGCKRMELDSGFQRERAHQFYETLGFQKRAYLFSIAL